MGGCPIGSQWGYDRVHRRAKSEGYRSRAAYKLLEIQQKFSVIRRDDSVVDLGAAPGSWLQVIRTLTDGKVLGIDLNPIADLEDVITIEGDLTDPELIDRVMELVGPISVVLSDAAPHLSGQRSYDQVRAVELGKMALTFACKVLKPGGNFVLKSFQGSEIPEFMMSLKQNFRSVRTYRPASTRRGSTEFYIISKNFMG